MLPNVKNNARYANYTGANAIANNLREKQVKEREARVQSFVTAMSAMVNQEQAKTKVSAAGSSEPNWNLLSPKSLNRVSVADFNRHFPAKAKHVDQAACKVVFVEKGKDLFTTNVKCCIAVAGIGRSVFGDIINIGLAHCDDVDYTVIGKLLHSMIHKAKEKEKPLSSISLRVIGGYGGTIGPEDLYGQIRETIRIYQNRTSHKWYVDIALQKLLNPYKVAKDVSRYEQEVDLIGFSLNVAVTAQGCTVAAYDSQLPGYSVQTMRVLHPLMENQEAGIKGLVFICLRNSKLKAEITSLIYKVIKNNQWLSPFIKQRFLSGCSLFFSMLGQRG